MRDLAVTSRKTARMLRQARHSLVDLFICYYFNILVCINIVYIKYLRLMHEYKYIFFILHRTVHPASPDLDSKSPVFMRFFGLFSLSKPIGKPMRSPNFWCRLTQPECSIKAKRNGGPRPAVKWLLWFDKAGIRERSPFYPLARIF